MSKKFKNMNKFNPIIITTIIIILLIIISIGLSKNSVEQIDCVNEEDTTLRKELIFEEAIIVDVEKENQSFTILPVENQFENEQLITIGLSDQSKIEHVGLKRIYPFDVLKKGMKVKIKYIDYAVQTKLYYEATYVEILEDNIGDELFLPSLDNVYIETINEDKQYIIVNQYKDFTGRQTVVYIDHHTNIKNEDDDIVYLIDQLDIGDKVTIITNGVMTESEKSETVGLEIILHNK
ncbi:MAG: hypothetical protein ACRCSG_04555 [Cellulosilyticaceae bacterium]